MNQEEMAVKLAEVESRSKSNTHRINELSNQLEDMNRLVTAMEVMANEQKHIAEAIVEMQGDLGSLKTQVKEIEQRPGKRWEGIVEKFVAGLVGAVAAAMAAGILWLIAGAPK